MGEPLEDWEPQESLISYAALGIALIFGFAGVLWLHEFLIVGTVRAESNTLWAIGITIFASTIFYFDQRRLTRE